MKPTVKFCCYFLSFLVISNVVYDLFTRSFYVTRRHLIKKINDFSNSIANHVICNMCVKIYIYIYTFKHFQVYLV